MAQVIEPKELICTRVLLMAEKPLSVKEIQERMHIGYDRKNIYSLINRLECAGYITNVIRTTRNGVKLNLYEAKLYE